MSNSQPERVVIPSNREGSVVPLLVAGHEVSHPGSLAVARDDSSVPRFPIPDLSLTEQIRETLGSSFTVERELGGGGMSRVFVAYDQTLERRRILTAGQHGLERVAGRFPFAAREGGLPGLEAGRCW